MEITPDTVLTRVGGLGHGEGGVVADKLVVTEARGQRTG
jgi:hypothetical protein